MAVGRTGGGVGGQGARRRGRRRGWAVAAVTAAAAVVVSAGAARAADFAWDPADDGAGGAGTWNLAALAFDAAIPPVAGAGNVAWVNGPTVATANNASFGGAAGGVALGAGVTAGTLTFAVPGYEFATGGNTLTLARTAGPAGAVVDVSGNNGTIALVNDADTTYALDVRANGATSNVNVGPATGGLAGRTLTVGAVRLADNVALAVGAVNAGSAFTLRSGALTFDGAAGTVRTGTLRRFAPASLEQAGGLTNWNAFGAGTLVVGTNNLGGGVTTTIGEAAGGVGNVRYDAPAALGAGAGQVTLNAGGTAWLNYAFTQADLQKFNPASTGVVGAGTAALAAPLDFSPAGINAPNLRLGSSVPGSATSGGAVYTGLLTPGTAGYQFGGGGEAVSSDVVQGVNTKLVISIPLGDVGGPTALTASGRDLVELARPNTYTGPTVARAGGNVYLSHPLAAGNSASVTASGTAVTSFGGVLLDPALEPLYRMNGGGPGSLVVTLDNGAIGWSADRLITGLPGAYSGATLNGTAGVNGVKVLNLGGTFSVGTMRQDGAYALQDDGATPVLLVKSGPDSTLDLTNAPAATGNTFTGGLHVAGGTVLFDKPNQLGAANSGRIVGVNGTLKLRPGAGAVTLPSGKVLDSTGGNGFNSLVGFGIDVTAGDSLVYAGPLEAGENSRHGYIKTGGGTFAYVPATLTSAGNASSTWGLNVQGGTVRVNQLPYRNQATGGATGVLEFRGAGGTLRVDAAPADVTALANFRAAYGFQQLSVFPGATATIEVGPGAVFKTNGRSNQSYTFVSDNASLIVQGAGATNGSQFQLGRFQSGNFVAPTGMGGTVDLRDVAFSLFAATSGNDFWPAQPEFTLKVNDSSVDTAYVSAPGNLFHNGNFAVNDRPSASRSTLNNFALRGTGNTSWRGTVEKVGAGTVELARTGGAVTVAPGATMVVSAGGLDAGGSVDPFTDSADPARRVAVVNDAAFTVLAGIKRVATITHAAPAATPAGTVRVAEGATLSTGLLRQQALSVDGGGGGEGRLVIRPAGGAPGTVNNRLETLAIAGGPSSPAGTLDLADTNLVLRYGAATSPEADVRGYLLQGYNGGAWTGLGIVSSTAAANPARAVGYAEAAAVYDTTDALPDVFHGDEVDGTTLLLRHTLSGDATLDGAVNFNDLVKLAQNYNTSDGQQVWSRGDFTYDGNVNFNDLVRLAQNYNTALPAGAIPGAPAGFAADLAAAFAAVPEPSSAMVLLTAGALAGVRRRRR